MSDPTFQHDRYVLRKKFFKLLGDEVAIDTADGRTVLRASQKAFKLKEEITVFDATGRFPVLQINARSVWDFSGTYDVIEVGSGARVGSIRRLGLQSMFRDEWRVLDSEGREIGSIFEDSMIMAIIRRFVGMIPQSFHFEHDGAIVASFRQHFNPIILKMDLDFTADASDLLDRRLGIAAAILLVLIEGRQQSE
jgi:uncharacterized protein YxjI